MCPYIRQKGKEKKKKEKAVEEEELGWELVEQTRKKRGNPYSRAYDDFVPKQISIKPKL